MAFNIIEISKLPTREFGRKSTEPRIGFAENGRFNFNKLVQEKWEGVENLLVRYDHDSKMILFNGLKAGQVPKGVNPSDLLKVSIGTGKSEGQMSAGGAGVLTSIGYDYKKAGNQAYSAKYDEKLKGFVVTIPAELPAMKPKQVRTKKADKIAGQVTTANGAAVPAAVIAPPAEEDLLEIS